MIITDFRQLTSPTLRILFEELTSCNPSTMSNHFCPFFRMIDLKLFHLLVILLSPLICLKFVGMLFLLRHFLPHFRSYLSDFSTSSNVMLFRNFHFLFIVIKEKTWRRTFWFVDTFKLLSVISLRGSPLIIFFFIIFSNHNWQLFFTLQLNWATLFFWLINFIINLIITFIFLNFNLLKLVALNLSLNFYSSCFICFKPFNFFEIVKNFFILTFEFHHTFLIRLSRCLWKEHVRNFLLICHLSPSFWYSFGKGRTISKLFWCFKLFILLLNLFTVLLEKEEKTWNWFFRHSFYVKSVVLKFTIEILLHLLD